jgi:4-oxalocrotonate tautomerase
LLPGVDDAGRLSGGSRERQADDKPEPARSDDGHQPRRTMMPFVNVKLIKGVFDADQKREMIEKLTDTMVEIEGEAMRPVTWVTIEEVESGEWGIGGKALTTQDVHDLQSAGVA